MTFPTELEAGIEDLLERERQCCAFLDIETRIENGLLDVEITSRNPDGLPVIEMLAGISNR
jgi:hypothetical protein